MEGLLSALNLSVGDRVFITPYTPMSNKLKRLLDEDGQCQVLGYVDKTKEGADIIKPQDVENHDFEKVLVLSPNWGVEIHRDLQKIGIEKFKLCLLELEPKVRTVSLIKHRVKGWLAGIRPWIIRFLQLKTKSWFVDHNTVLLLSPDFVDLNIKDLYIALQDRGDCRVVLATDNKHQSNKLIKSGFDVIDFYSIRYIWESLRSSVKVMDHNPITSLIKNSLINSKVVQIWHGIPLKKIGHLADYKKVKYDLVVSTSPFVTDSIFKTIFDFREISDCGYPRNDILVTRVKNKKNMSLVNEEILQWVLNKGKKIIIYMPTWRSDSFSSNPINLDNLNRFCRDNDFVMIIKMHPFIRANTFFDTLESDSYQFRKNYNNSIVFYPSEDDIYPLFGCSSLLVTDYSSVYFDYLFVNKPIIFFMYDREEYVKIHGDFMFDTDSSVPGKIVSFFSCLKSEIIRQLECDEYLDRRNLCMNRFFSRREGRSSQDLADKVTALCGRSGSIKKLGIEQVS